MAAERTITIRIVSEQSSAPNANAQPTESDIKSSKPSPGANEGAGSGNEGGFQNSKSASYAAAYYLTKQSVALINKNVAYGFNRYMALTENYKGEQQIENIKASISEISGVASSAFSGAAIGSKWGPWGAVIGAVIGLGFGVGKAVLERGQTLVEQERYIHEEAYALYFNTVRAGQVNYSRGTEN